jgi:hypothetical protein
MITVVAVTGVDLEGHLRAIERTQAAIPHFTRQHLHYSPGMTREDYSVFIVKRLHELITTEFALICQADGYGINRGLWTDEFLEYDYTGAPFPNGQVGNGGLALRSKRFLEVSAALPDPDIPEDAYLCQYRRSDVEAALMRFAPIEIAQRFSYEHPVAGHPWSPEDSWGRHFPK